MVKPGTECPYCGIGIVGLKKRANHEYCASKFFAFVGDYYGRIIRKHLRGSKMTADEIESYEIFTKRIHISICGINVNEIPRGFCGKGGILNAKT